MPNDPLIICISNLYRSSLIRLPISFCLSKKMNISSEFLLKLIALVSAQQATTTHYKNYSNTLDISRIFICQQNLFIRKNSIGITHSSYSLSVLFSRSVCMTFFYT